QVDTHVRELAATIRELERQREAVAHATSEVAVKESEAAQLRADVNARAAALARLAAALETQAEALARLQASLAEATRRLDDVHRSFSWRWTAPARAIYRMLGLDRRGPVC
ncbi:MAG TPA: hypothetical protein VGJ29_10405, partial [Vicinamibacterales bacterium]